MPKRPRAGNARHCRMNRLGLINCAAAATHFIPAIRRTGSYDLTKRAAAIQRIPPTGSGATRALAQQLSHAGRRYPRPSLCRSSRQRAGARRTLYGTFHCTTSLGYKKYSSKSILGFLLFRYAYLAIFYLISCRVVSGKTPSPPSQTLAYVHHGNHQPGNRHNKNNGGPVTNFAFRDRFEFNLPSIKAIHSPSHNSNPRPPKYLTSRQSSIESLNRI